MATSIFIEDLIDRLMRYLRDNGVEDIVIRGKRIDSYVIKFHNNNISVCESRNNVILNIFIGVKRRIAELTFHTLDEQVIIKELDKYLKAVNYLPEVEGYRNLPEDTVEYEEPLNVFHPDDMDPIKGINLIEGLINKITENNKVSRISGSLNMNLIKEVMKASNGRYCEERKTNFNLSVRGFRDDIDVSYQANSISTSLSSINTEEITDEIKGTLTLSDKCETVTPGKYDLILSPLAVANLFGHFTELLSAYYIENNISPFVNSLGKKIAADLISLYDYPLMNGNPGAKVFDDSGEPTKNTDIIVNGALCTYLHNWITAGKFGAENTGHAGIFVPQPHSIILSEGDLKTEELFNECKHAIVISNVWYTRFQNYYEGIFSSLQRDVALLMDHGDIKTFLSGIRISEMVSNILLNVTSVAKERKWVMWWDHPYPSLVPYIMVKDVNITTAT